MFWTIIIMAALVAAGVARALSLVDPAVATAMGLAVVGVYLSFGRTRWRSALCGAGTCASFLSVGA